MNNFHRPHGGLQEADAPEEAVRSPFSDLAGRFANWMTGADRMAPDGTPPADEPEMGHGTEPPAPLDPPVGEDSARFPLAPFGYNRTAVDEQIARLERELDELRAKHEPMGSITDELERIGEQTSSILVVAHDQAHETTRLAEQQAERCVADAAANAVQITAQAKAKLRDLDAETDAVWRERERLLEDVRVVSTALANLADQASERFPAAEATSSTGGFAAVAAPAHAIWEELEYAPEPEQAQAEASHAAEPQATEPFNAIGVIDTGGAYPGEVSQSENSGDQEEEGEETAPGDTGSWLAGLEPPDLQSGRD